MTEGVHGALVSELAYDAVLRVAPQEAPLFRAISETYLKHPEDVRRAGSGSDDLLGFGGVGEVNLITPIALAVASEVVHFVATEVLAATRKEASAEIGDVVRSAFKRLEREQARPVPPAEMAAVTLTPDQLATVHQLAYEKACQLHLSVHTAGLLADALAGSLVVEGR